MVLKLALVLGLFIVGNASISPLPKDLEYKWCFFCCYYSMVYMGFLLVSLLVMLGFVLCKLLIYKSYFWGLTLPLEYGIMDVLKLRKYL